LFITGVKRLQGQPHYWILKPRITIMSDHHYKIASLSRRLFVVAAGCFIVFLLARYKSNSLPAFPPSTNNLSNAPLQTPSQRAPFKVTSNDRTYQIQPRFDYSMRGFLVSQHDTSSWMNISHKRWGDFVNIKDVCLVWGRNSSNGDLHKVEFWNGDWTCNFRTKDMATWNRFSLNEVSNNHLLAATPEIAEKIRSSRIGDVVELKGMLIDYNIDGGPFRKTSTVRDDTGNGACEIIYVEEFRVLESANRLWHLLSTLTGIFSALSMTCSLLVFFAAPAVLNKNS